MKKHLLTRAAMAFLLSAAVACGGRSEPQPIAASDPGAALVVERFLQAANQHDLRVMSELFGTRKADMRKLEGVTYAEELAHLQSSLLRHDDFTIVAQQVVPGRMHEATQVLVRMKSGQRVMVVPFTVVRRQAGGWIIEQIDLEKVTGRGLR